MPTRSSSTPEGSPAMSRPPPEGCQAPKEDPTIITVSTRPSERSQIALHPSHVLRQIAASMNGHPELPLVTLPHSTKWGSAISAMQTSLCGKENELLLLNKPVPKEAKQRLRHIALQFAGPSNQNIPFLIRTNVNLSSLPEPRKPSAAVMSMLKENAKRFSDGDPYVINVRAIVGDGYLPSIAGRLKISALDGSDEHPQDRVSSPPCAFWTQGRTVRQFPKIYFRPLSANFWTIQCMSRMGDQVHATSYKWIPCLASQIRRWRYPQFS